MPMISPSAPRSGHQEMGPHAPESPDRPTPSRYSPDSGSSGVQPDVSIRVAIGRIGALLRSVSDPLRRHLPIVLGTALLAGVFTAAATFLVREEFRSTVTFFVDRSKPAMSLPSGLAALGRSLGVGDGDDAQPLDFYAWLATSDGVVESVLNDTVPLALRTAQVGDPQEKSAWYYLTGKPRPKDSVKMEKAVAQLRDDIQAGVDEPTSTISVTTPGPSRAVSMWAASRLFGAINEANTSRRTTRARRELEFLKGRLRDAEITLQDAEVDLARFYESNRQAVLPPSLRIESERRQRNVEIAQETYLGLTKAVQDAEVRAVRNIPALTLIDGPSIPVRRSKPRRLLLTLLGTLLGFATGYAMAWWRVERDRLAPTA